MSPERAIAILRAYRDENIRELLSMRPSGLGEHPDDWQEWICDCVDYATDHEAYAHLNYKVAVAAITFAFEVSI